MRRRARIGIGIGAAVAYAATLLLFGLLAGVSVANHTVNVSTEQEYRDALTDLSGGDTSPHTINVIADITIDDGTDPTYAGTEPLTINGNGHTLDATGTSRVLLHDSAADLTINDLAVTGGDADFGGGIRAGGVGASVTVTNSTISGNTAVFSGGGIGDGGVGASVTVTNSTISGNTAGSGGGGVRAAGPVTVTNSTVSGNTAGADGGGIDGSGSVTVTNSTVSGNTAGDDGGGVSAVGPLTLIHATVVENSDPNDANVAAQTGLTSFGSVVALPQGGGVNCDVSGGTTSNGYNYSDDASCGFTGTGDTQDGPDPNLGALANNGGPTQTMLPLTGSPLIDAIPVADCHETVTDDQRGVDRPQDGDEDGTFACDIGAVEVQPGAKPAKPVEGQPSFTG